MDQNRTEVVLGEKVKIVNGMEINLLTGLLVRHAFFERAEEFLKQAEPSVYCVLAIDLEHFRLFNKIYGREQGDRLLGKIGNCLSDYRFKYGGVTGYFGGDNFAVLTYYEAERFRQLHRRIAEEIRNWSNTVGFLPAFGIYIISEDDIPVVTMYDRATIALKQIIGNYTQRHCIYSSNMDEKEERELLLLSEIQGALDRDEFTFYIQPQCDISTGKIVGGESLVRWQHPTKGLIAPGAFIPVLEKNGFIANLDRYIWTKVCQWMRELIDKGYQPVPISINVSPVEIFSMDVSAYLAELLYKYNLPAELLKVEITESAYAENYDKIVNTVKQLHDTKLWVMMDDFGSGYSSLNMLKSIAVDVLKMDMRFLDINEKEEEKGISILESVVNMARQMHLPIIVEGVETQKQEKYLLKMGCRYAQGYYYYRPMPKADFESLLREEHNLDLEGIWYKRVEAIHLNEFLDKNIFNDTMFNNILGPAAFYDMYENNVEIIRVNNQYYELAGISSKEVAESNSEIWIHACDEDKPLLRSIFAQAEENQSEGASGYVHFLRANGELLWVRVNIFFLREHDGHKIFYGSILDLTELHDRKYLQEDLSKDVEMLTEKQQKHLEKHYGELPFGYAVAKVVLDESEKAKDYEVVYANHEICRINGGNMDRIRFMANKAFGDRRDELLEKIFRAAYLGEKTELYIYSTVSSRYLKFLFGQYQHGYIYCIMQDETRAHVYENTMKNLLTSCRKVYYVHLQENYGRMVYPDNNHLMEKGNHEDVVEQHIASGKIWEDDIQELRNFLSLQNMCDVLKKQDSAEYKYRRNENGVAKWSLVTIKVCDKMKGIPMSAVLIVENIEA